MKSSFSRKKRQKSPFEFEKSHLQESTGKLCNPGCGWYRIFSFKVEEKPDLQEAGYCLEPEDSLVLVMLHIGAYRGKALDEKAFAHMRQILSFFVEKKKDMILRMVYDNEGRGLEHEPGMFGQVLAHIGQLKPLLREFAEYIYVFQGFLVGSWGEMHTSKFLAPKQLRQLEGALREDLGKDTFLAVRRPVYYRILHTAVGEDRKLGMFDDAIFGSDTHLGTYGTQSKNQVGWESPWNPAEELDFEEELGRYAPCGGEAVFDEQKNAPTDLAEAAEKLRKMRVSYLNSAHDIRLLESWKNMAWKGKDCWKGMGGYDYIGRHLGYRFRIRETEVVFFPDEEKEWCLLLRMEIVNDGFACCYEAGELLLEGESGWSKTIPLDFGQLLPGKSLTVEAVITPQQEKLYVSLLRSRDKRKLELANAPVPGERGGSPGSLCLGLIKG